MIERVADQERSKRATVSLASRTFSLGFAVLSECFGDTVLEVLIHQPRRHGLQCFGRRADLGHHVTAVLVASIIFVSPRGLVLDTTQPLGLGVLELGIATHGRPCPFDRSSGSPPGRRSGQRRTQPLYPYGVYARNVHMRHRKDQLIACEATHAVDRVQSSYPSGVGCASDVSRQSESGVMPQHDDEAEATGSEGWWPALNHRRYRPIWLCNATGLPAVRRSRTS